VPFDPIDAPCDYILLAGQKSPGVAEIVGASSPREWEERNGYGVTGGFSVFMRRKLARFSVRLRLYESEDWIAWRAWKPIVDKLPKRRGGSGADSGMLSIWSPQLEDLDIKAVGVAEVGQPEQTGDGEWTIEIKFIEHRSPKVTLAKPQGAAAEPVDPIDKVIEGLTDQFQSLAHDGPPPLPTVPP